MRERALYAMTFGLGAVTAGLIAYAAWRLLPPEPAHVIIGATHEPRAAEPRGEIDLPMKNAEAHAQLAPGLLSPLGEDVSKRGAEALRPDGAGEQPIVTASVSPPPIGGPFVVSDGAVLAAPVSERPPVPAPEADTSLQNGSQTPEQRPSAAAEAHPAAAPESHAGDKRAQDVGDASHSPKKHPPLAEGTRPKAQKAARKAARQAASKSRRSVAKARSRRLPPKKMRGRLSVRVWRGEPAEHLYVYDPMIPSGPRIIVVEPD